MKVVIIGAGDIGQAIASLLSGEHHDVILVDSDPVRLERAAQELDIAIREGSGTDWGLLEELKELNPDLLIAVTQGDEINLVCCSIAKGLGYPRTIARGQAVRTTVAPGCHRRVRRGVAAVVDVVPRRATRGFASERKRKKINGDSGGPAAADRADGCALLEIEMVPTE